MSGVVDYAADLLPGGSFRPLDEPDVVFVLGSAQAPDGSVRVSGSDWRAAAGAQSPAVPWTGTGSVAAMAAADAATTTNAADCWPNLAVRRSKTSGPAALCATIVLPSQVV